MLLLPLLQRIVSNVEHLHVVKYLYPLTVHLPVIYLASMGCMSVHLRYPYLNLLAPEFGI